jgi:FLVCR family feline leukemia virus subgroup C receptor-related protein
MPLVGGILSSMGISSVVRRYRKYKMIALILMVASMIICMMFYPALLTNKISLCYLCGFFVGFFLVPMIPVVMELCCEIIYPLNGSFAVGILYSGSTLTTVVSSQILTIITKGTDSDKQSCLNGIILIIALLVVGAIMFSFVKEVQNRT